MQNVVFLDSIEKETVLPEANKSKHDVEEKSEGVVDNDKSDVIAMVKDIMVEHIWKAVENSDNRVEKLLSEEEETEINYQCGVCGKIFQSSDDANHHIVEAHE